MGLAAVAVPQQQVHGLCAFLPGCRASEMLTAVVLPRCGAMIGMQSLLLPHVRPCHADILLTSPALRCTQPCREKCLRDAGFVDVFKKVGWGPVGASLAAG